MSVRRMCAALAALALLLALVLALLMHGRPKAPAAPQERASEQDVMITDISVGSIAAAALSSGGESTALMVQGDAVVLLDAPQGAAISDQLLKAYLYRMAHMPAERTLGTIGDPAEYGFDNYEAAVALLGLDGSRTRLFLGSQAPFEPLWYLMREGDETLYLVDEMTAQMMRYTTDDFRDLQIFPQISAGGLSDINRLTLISGEAAIDIHGVEQDGAMYFYMAYPYDCLLSWERVADMLISPLAALDKEDYVSGDVSPAEYGLYGSDAVSLTMVINGQESTLLFSPADETHLYCARKGADDVVLVSRENAAFLETRAMDLMDQSLYARGAADADSVEVFFAGRQGRLNISGSGTMLRGQIGAKTLDQKQTVDLYKKLTMLPPAQALDEAQAISGGVVLEMVVHLKDGTDDSIALIPVSERRCAVVINGEAAFATYTAAVQEIARVCVQAFGM